MFSIEQFESFLRGIVEARGVDGERAVNHHSCLCTTHSSLPFMAAIALYFSTRHSNSLPRKISIVLEVRLAAPLSATASAAVAGSVLSTSHSNLVARGAHHGSRLL